MVTVEAALERELESLEPDLAASTLAATARVLARELDNPKNSATSKSMCAGRMYEALERLADLAPEEAVEDDLEAVRRKREVRRAGVA